MNSNYFAQVGLFVHGTRGKCLQIPDQNDRISLMTLISYTPVVIEFEFLLYR